MNLKDSVESERSQADQETPCAFTHVQSKRDALVEVESRVLVTPDGGWKKGEDVSQSYSILVTAVCVCVGGE